MKIKIKKRKKRPIIFIMGKTYDMNVISLGELELDLQKQIDSLHSERVWRITVDDNLCEIEPGENFYYTFTIERGNEIPMYCYNRYDDNGYMCDSDAELLTNTPLTGWKVSDYMERDSRHKSINQEEFVDRFNSLCQSNGASIPKFIELIQDYQYVLQVIIEYPETR